MGTKTYGYPRVTGVHSSLRGLNWGQVCCGVGNREENFTLKDAWEAQLSVQA